MRKILPVVLMFASCMCCSAQVVFQKTFGDSLDDVGNDIFITSDNGYVITGSSGVSGCVIRTDSIADSLWTSIYYGGLTSPLVGSGIFQNNDGSFVVSGNSNNSIGYLFKINTQGNLVWSEYYEPAFGNATFNTVLICSDNKYIVSGARAGGTMFLAKVDTAGTLIWDNIYGLGSTTFKGYSIKEASDGGFIIAGYTSGWLGTHPLLVKISATGVLIWEKLYGLNQRIYSVQQTNDGGYITAGQWWPSGGAVIIKMDSLGQEEWQWEYYGSSNDVAKSVLQTSDGGFVIAGTTYINGNLNADAFLIRTDSTGLPLWGRTYGGSGEDKANNVKATNDGGYIIIGSTKSFGAGGSDIYLIKTDSVGLSGCNEHDFYPDNTFWWNMDSTIVMGDGVQNGAVTNWLPNVHHGLELGNSCFAQCTFSLMFNSQNVFCNGDSSGSIIVNPSGGTPPYTYSWSPTGDTTATINNVPAGNYTVTVTDSLGCSATQVVSITQPTPLVATICSQTNLLCYGDSNACATVCASGGTPPYTYLWATTETDTTICGLHPGLYSVTVYDANGCTAETAASITQPAAPVSATASALQNVSCNGGYDGVHGATASGGTPPYTYMWSPGGCTAATCSFLPAGCYTVSVVDANGCMATDVTCITEPPAITFSTGHTNNLCRSDSAAMAWISIFSGVPPFTYSWSPYGGTNATATGLPAGNYTITATDSNGCSVTGFISVFSPTQVNVGIIPTNLRCYGDSSGNAIAVVSGGTPPYTYSWSPYGGNNDTVTNLAAGNYTVTVTDINGCTKTHIVSITQPPLLAVTLSVTDASCFSCCDGISSAMPSGGIPPYTYDWTPGNPTIQTFTDQCTGIYTCCLTDANGCMVCASDTVSYPSIIIGDIPLSDGFSIHPNPFSNQLIIHSTANTEAILTLYDYTGKIILYRKSFTEETILNTEGIAEGIYLLRVESGGRAKNYKVVKQ